MQKGHSVASGAGPWCTVDQLDASRVEPSEIGLEVFGAVGDVMKGRPSSVEESADGRVGSERLEQLDGSDEGDFDALGLEGLGVGTGLTREEFEQTAAVFNGMDGDRNVVDGAVRVRHVNHRRMLHSVQYGDKEIWNANE